MIKQAELLKILEEEKIITAEQAKGLIQTVKAEDKKIDEILSKLD